MQQFQVPLYLDYLATFAWAVSGAVVGMRQRFDLTGVFVIAVVSAVGGGLLRDGLFLQRTPVLVTNPVYIPLILMATVFAIFVGRRLESSLTDGLTDRAVTTIDSIGVPAFAVVGMQLAFAAGIPIPGVLLIGVINGTGGGLLRDVLVNEQPMLLRPGQHVTLILVAACGLYVILTRYLSVQSNFTGWLVIGLFMAARGMALYFDLRTSPVANL